MVKNPKARKMLIALRKDTEKWFKQMDKKMAEREKRAKERMKRIQEVV